MKRRAKFKTLKGTSDLIVHNKSKYCYDLDVDEVNMKIKSNFRGKFHVLANKCHRFVIMVTVFGYLLLSISSSCHLYAIDPRTNLKIETPSPSSEDHKHRKESLDSIANNRLSMAHLEAETKELLESRVRNSISRLGRSDLQLKKLLSRPKFSLSSFVPHLLSKQITLKGPRNQSHHNHIVGQQVRLPTTTLLQPIVAFSHQPITSNQNMKFHVVPDHRFQAYGQHSRLFQPLVHQTAGISSFSRDQFVHRPYPGDEAERGLFEVDSIIKGEYESRMNLNSRLGNQQQSYVSNLTDPIDALIRVSSVSPVDEEPTSDSNFNDNYVPVSSSSPIMDGSNEFSVTTEDSNSLLESDHSEDTIESPQGQQERGSEPMTSSPSSSFNRAESSDLESSWRPTDYPPTKSLETANLRRGKILPNEGEGNRDYSEDQRNPNSGQTLDIGADNSRGLFVPSGVETIAQLKLNNTSDAHNLKSRHHLDVRTQSNSPVRVHQLSRLNPRPTRDQINKHSPQDDRNLIGRELYLKNATTDEIISSWDPNGKTSTGRPLRSTNELTKSNFKHQELAQRQQSKDHNFSLQIPSNNAATSVVIANQQQVNLQRPPNLSHIIEPLIAGPSAVTEKSLAKGLASRRPSVESHKETMAADRSESLTETLRKLRETEARIRQLQAELNATQSESSVSQKRGFGGRRDEAQDQEQIDESDESSESDDGDESETTNDAGQPVDAVLTGELTNVEPERQAQKSTQKPLKVPPTPTTDWFRSWSQQHQEQHNPLSVNSHKDDTLMSSDPRQQMSKFIKSQQALSLPIGMYHNGPLTSPGRLMASAFGRAAHNAIGVPKSSAFQVVDQRYSAAWPRHKLESQSFESDLTRLHSKEPNSGPILLGSSITVASGQTANQQVARRPGQVTKADYSPDASSIAQATFAVRPEQSTSTTGAYQQLVSKQNLNNRNAFEFIGGQQSEANHKSPEVSSSHINGTIAANNGSHVTSEMNSNRAKHFTETQSLDFVGSKDKSVNGSQITPVSGKSDATNNWIRQAEQNRRISSDSSKKSKLLNLAAGYPSNTNSSGRMNAIGVDTNATAKTIGAGLDEDTRKLDVADTHGGNFITNSFKRLLDIISGDSGSNSTIRESRASELNSPDATKTANSTIQTPDGDQNSKLTTEKVLQTLIVFSCSLALVCLVLVYSTLRCRSSMLRSASRQRIHESGSQVSSLMNHLATSRYSPSSSPLNWRKNAHLVSEPNSRQHQRKKLVHEGAMKNISLLARHLHTNKSQVGRQLSSHESCGMRAPKLTRSCCHCVSCSESWLFRESAQKTQQLTGETVNGASKSLCPSGYYHPAPRGKLPFGAASSVNKILNNNSKARMNHSNQQVQEHNPNKTLDRPADFGIQESGDGRGAQWSGGRMPTGGTRMRMMSAIEEGNSNQTTSEDTGDGESYEDSPIGCCPAHNMVTCACRHCNQQFCQDQAQASYCHGVMEANNSTVPRRQRPKAEGCENHIETPENDCDRCTKTSASVARGQHSNHSECDIKFTPLSSASSSSQSRHDN